MKLAQVILSAAVGLAGSALGLAVPKTDTNHLSTVSIRVPTPKHASTGGHYAGYLATFFYSQPLEVWLALSEGNNASSFTVLNGGNPILSAPGGQKAIRDPHIIIGGGREAGRKWYITTTDQNSNTQPSWAWAETNGSLAINVWDSHDAADWGDYRNVQVEDHTAGMVWAPDAMWDEEKGEYFVYWSSRLFADNDTYHTGPPSAIVIRAAYTADFRTFSAPFTYVNGPDGHDVIDLNIVHICDSTYYRFLKDEILKNTYVEYTTNGLHGDWIRNGNVTDYIKHHTEGPAGYVDNIDPGLIHLWLDDFSGADGYHPYQSTEPTSQSSWTLSNQDVFPTGMHHGKVIPVDKKTYGIVKARWG